MQWNGFPAFVQLISKDTVKLNTTHIISSKINITLSSISGERRGTYEVIAHRGHNSYSFADLKLLSVLFVQLLYF